MQRALGHHDFNAAGSTSYEQCLEVAQHLRVGRDDLRELFRRMVFNVLGFNRDDHCKNIAFLMDAQGQWRLSPAYDICFSYNPSGAWTARHQMRVNGKRESITDADLLSVAKRLRLHNAPWVIDEVRMSIRSWPQYAKEAGVFGDDFKRIDEIINRQL